MAKRKSKIRNYKRLILMSDTHCGHVAGLTPPDWHYNHATTNPRVMAVYEQQTAMWEWYTRRIDELKPIDYLFVLGDLVDGSGKRSGGTEQRTTDGNEQAAMAAECINYVESPRVLITYGTPYHVGTDQDQEDAVVPLLNGKAEIHSHAFVDINGITFDLKHFVASSSIPHGKWTPLVKDKVWNTVWHAEHALQPKSDVICRGHVHYHIDAGESDSWRAMTCPAMMGFGSKYGKRICKGVVHVGFIVFDFPEEGGYSWRPELLRLELHKAPVLKW